MTGADNDYNRGFRGGYSAGYDDALRKDHDAIFRQGYREGVLATCWTAVLNGHINGRQKNELYTELLTPDGMRPSFFSWAVWRFRALLRVMTAAPDDPR